MKYLINIIILITFTSCSFKSTDSKTGEESSVQALSSLDSDGDLISDLSEKSQGLDPYIANIPKLETSFIQNFDLSIQYEDNSEFKIATEVERDNANFRYKVGDLFLKQNSLDHAAKVGRFSGVSWGVIDQKDFSWVRYPKLGDDFYFLKKKEYEAFKAKKITELSISLQNTLKLTESPLWDSIENLELNFYYYSYSKEAYVQLHTEKIDKVFQAGVKEEFQISIQNPPLELIEDTFLRHGEFIISEIKDFYIPSLNISYSTFLNSVKEKSIPIYKTTPFETDLNFVAVSDSGDSFVNILKKLYGDNFKVEDEKLAQVQQFSSNLTNFKNLFEVNSETKSGNWFVFTNKLKKHYLKHRYTREDSITISYIVGADLSRRKKETIYTEVNGLYSTSTESKHFLGEITKNSNLSFSLYLKQKKGVRLNQEHGHFSFSPKRCRNCSGNNWNVKADFAVNTFSDYEEEFDVDSFEELSQGISVLVNNTELDLIDLIQKNFAKVELRDSELGQYLHVEVTTLHNLEAFIDGEVNKAYLLLSAFNIAQRGEGLEIKSVTGKNIDRHVHANIVAVKQAASRQIGISTSGWDFSKWENYIPWGKKTGLKYKPWKGAVKKSFDGIVVDVISKISNFYN